MISQTLQMLSLLYIDVTEEKDHDNPNLPRETPSSSSSRNTHKNIPNIVTFKILTYGLSRHKLIFRLYFKALSNLLQTFFEQTIHTFSSYICCKLCRPLRDGVRDISAAKTWRHYRNIRIITFCPCLLSWLSGLARKPLMNQHLGRSINDQLICLKHTNSTDMLFSNSAPLKGKTI